MAAATTHKYYFWILPLKKIVDKLVNHNIPRRKKTPLKFTPEGNIPPEKKTPRKKILLRSKIALNPLLRNFVKWSDTL